MKLGFLPVGLQINLRRFEHHAPAHQSAPHPQRFLPQVVDGRRGADSIRLAACREEGVPYRLAGSHSGHSDAGQIKAQDPADGPF